MNQLFRRFGAALCALALCLTPASALSMEDAIGLLEQYYVDELPDAVYRAQSLDELSLALGDPYTFYMPAESYENFTANIESESSITGLGVTIEYTANGIEINSILSGSGAEAVGLEVGDLIVAVDGVSCVPATEAARARILGEAGTYVTVTVRRSDGSERDFRVERRTVPIHNTTFYTTDGIGVIVCKSFSMDTGSYFDEGIYKNDSDVRIWLADVRGNSGGVTDSAVNALGDFTGRGVKLIYRDGDKHLSAHYFNADRMTDKPLIALTNSKTASAAELFSGGTLAAEAGIVIGTRTYGKGTAQIVLDKNNMPGLFDGDSFKITTDRFYLINGNTTDHIGVLPTLYAYGGELIAELLCADKPAEGDYLHLILNGIDFYVDLEKARTDNYIDALSELFSALPPDAALSCVVDGAELPLGPALAAEELGISYLSRTFDDVSSSRYANEINTLAVYDLLRGDETGNFNPERTLTRAELCSMLCHVLNVRLPGASEFSDVEEGRWYTDYVNAMAHLGLVNGFENGRFEPGAALTQEQFIAIMGRLTRFLNFLTDEYALSLDEEDLADSALASWARESECVLTGYDGNMLFTARENLAPKDAVTREQAAATMYNILRTLRFLSY